MWAGGGVGGQGARGGVGKGGCRSEGTEELVQGIGEKVRGNREWEKWSGNGVGG